MAIAGLSELKTNYLKREGGEKIMDILEVNKNIYFKCSTHGRYGQTERAELNINCEAISTGSYHWENRPWQGFDYDIAMNKAFDNAKKRLSPHYIRTIKKWLDNGGKREEEKVNKQFGMIAGIMKMGEILTPDQKSSNDWKTRMLKAGLENKGLIMPEDWDQLSEDEKTKRLDGVIAQFSN